MELETENLPLRIPMALGILGKNDESNEEWRLCLSFSSFKSFAPDSYEVVPSGLERTKVCQTPAHVGGTGSSILKECIP